MLEIVDLTVKFGDYVALDQINLELRQGETLAVLGPSGSGKSTLLRAIAGLEIPDGGEVRWEGAVLGTRAPHTRGFGLVFQDYALFPHLDIGANVRFGLEIAGLDDDLARRRVVEVLEMVGLSCFHDRSTETLSGGERQRVALARALAPNPRLLMLDEPVAALDRHLRARLLAELADLLRDLSTPAIYVTHDQSEAFALADRVAVLSEGRLLQVGEPERVWRNPASIEVATFLGLENIAEVRVQDDVIATPWGAVNGTLAAGTHRIAVPAASVRLDPAGPITAIVGRSVFVDGRYRVELQVLNRVLVAEVAGPRPLEGSRVSVTIDTDAIVVIPS